MVRDIVTSSNRDSSLQTIRFAKPSKHMLRTQLLPALTPSFPPRLLLLPNLHLTVLPH